MFSRRLLLIVVLLVAVVTGAWFFHRHWTSQEIHIELSQTQIDEMLAKQFPKKKKYLKVIKITYTDPRVELIENSKQVRIGLKVKAAAGIGGLEKEYLGSISVVTEVGYDADKKQVFLDRAQLERLELPKVPENYLRLTEQAVSLASQEFFQEIPVYTIPQKDWKHQMARFLVKSISTDGGKLRITLQPPAALVP